MLIYTCTEEHVPLNTYALIHNSQNSESDKLWSTKDEWYNLYWHA